MGTAVKKRPIAVDAVPSMFINRCIPSSPCMTSRISPARNPGIADARYEIIKTAKKIRISSGKINPLRFCVARCVSSCVPLNKR